MTGIVVVAGFFYRRLEILNSAAVAALILLVAKPSSAFDTSFQLSFLAIGCIAGVAVPWMERHLPLYVGAVYGLGDGTRGRAFSARQVPFRLVFLGASAGATSRLFAANRS